MLQRAILFKEISTTKNRCRTDRRRNGDAMKPVCCGFIGLGLIGGSIAKALKEHHKEITLYAYDINPETLALAKAEGIADEVSEQIGERFSECDILFLCAPVSCNDDNLLRLKEFLSKDCILTDVGSVKTGIHKQIAQAGLEHLFIGGHPMAGSERYGYANSKAKLLENAYYILTPTPSVSAEKLSFYKELVSSIGAIPLVLSYTEHDYVTAAVSHLPHVIAASLVNLVKDSDSAEGVMKMIAAGGFKDITRIASSSSTMWQQICLTNTENISALLDTYIHMLQSVKEQIDARREREIFDFFNDARIYRDSFIEASSGPIKKEYAIWVDIADEPGAIASIATMLALNGISIKNIGITHNRESEEGALRIEFYEEAGMLSAVTILTNRGYSIYGKK